VLFAIAELLVVLTVTTVAQCEPGYRAIVSIILSSLYVAILCNISDDFQAAGILLGLRDDTVSMQHFDLTYQATALVDYTHTMHFGKKIE